MKTLLTIATILALATTAQAHAESNAATAAPALSREAVKAQTLEAIRTGDLPFPVGTLKLKDVNPGFYARTRATQPTAASSRDPADARLEAKAAGRQ